MALRGGVEYSEAIAAAKARGVVLPQEYYGLLQKEMRSRAFSVARISNINRIQDILESLEQATQRGDSLGRWQKQMREGGLDKLFINRAHAETVYINAMQTHYSIGRWAQFQDNKERRPYLMYDAVNDSRTRPAHRKLDGFIARIDDPVWDRIAVPGGHRCRCGLIALTEKQAALRGGPTGEIPPGAGADPGWEYNPETQHDDVLQNILDGYANNLPPSIQDIARYPMPTISPESLDVRGINKALREWQRTEPAMTEPVRIGAVSPQLESAFASQGEPLSLPKEQAIIELYQEAVRANAKAADGLINEPLAEIITLANYGDFASAFGLTVSHQEIVQSGLTLQAGRVMRIAQSFGVERDAMAAWASEALLYNSGDAATTLAKRLAGETGRDASVFLDLFDALDADDFGALLLSKVLKNG